MREARRLGEFELIDRYFRPLASDPGAFGLSDDAALYTPREDEDLVLKTDLIAAGVHFFPDDPPGSIAQKALRVNLSDLAAKGREPGRLPALASRFRKDWTEAWIASFARGLKADQERYGITLLGGDTNRASGGADRVRRRPRPRPEGRDGAPLGRDARRRHLRLGHDRRRRARRARALRHASIRSRRGGASSTSSTATSTRSRAWRSRRSSACTPPAPWTFPTA